MINQYYDNIIVGKSYISTLTSLIKLINGESVLQVEDSRVNLSGGWVQTIGLLERHFMFLIGSKYQISPLLNFNEYLTYSETVYWLDNRQIVLGNSFSRNMKELCRKLPELFGQECFDALNNLSEEEINKQMETYCMEVSEYAFKYLNFQNFDEKLFIDKMPMLLKSFYNGLTQAFQKDADEFVQMSLRKLMFVLQVVGQTFFTNGLSKFEIISLLISAISSRHRIDTDRLNHDLKSHFKSRGGHTCSSDISEWQFYQNSLENILLSSYHGLVGTNNTYLFGSIDDRFPFYLDTKDFRTFSNLFIKIIYPEEIFKEYKGTYLTFCSSEKLGTDFPLWQARFDESNKVLIKYLYPKRSGSKPEFFFNKASLDIFEAFSKIFPSISLDKFNFYIEMNEGDDLWLEKFKGDTQFRRQLVFRSPDRSDFKLKDSEHHRSLKKIEFWGPQKSKPLGFFSYLMELKNLCFEQNL